MVDPISVVSGIAGVATGCTKIVQSLNTLKDKFKFAEQTIASLSTECFITSIGLSQLQSALQNSPDLLMTLSDSQDELTTCFEMGIWCIAKMFSLLHDDVSKLNEKSHMGYKLSFGTKARYMLIEDSLKERLQQIRDQRSSLHFLLECVKQYVPAKSNRNLRDDPKALQAAQPILRRNYTNAKSLRSKSSSTTLRDYGVGDLEIDLEKKQLKESFQQQPHPRRTNSSQSKTQSSDGFDGNQSMAPSNSSSPVSSPVSQANNLPLSALPILAQQTDTNYSVNAEGTGNKDGTAARDSPSRNRTTSDDDDRRQQSIELHVAVRKGYLRRVQTLLQKGSDVNLLVKLAEDTEEISPLWRAVIQTPKRESKPMIQLLTKSGADLDGMAKNPAIHTALNLAVKGELESTDSDDRTPLLRAVKEESTDLVRALLDAGSNINHKDANGNTSLYIAAEFGHIPVLKLLLQRGAIMEANDRNGYTKLHFAALCGHLEITDSLIQEGAVIDAKCWKGLTPLHLAAQRGHVAVSELLIRKGADVNARNSDGIRPLHGAVSFRRDGHDKNALIKLLLDSGAHINAKYNIGISPLMDAARNDDVATVELLLRKGADIKAADANGESAIHYAASKGSINALTFLLSQARIHVDCRRAHGATALHLAAAFGYRAACEVLLEKGAIVDSKDDHGQTPLMGAMVNSVPVEAQDSIVKLLLARGADINAQDDDGYSALYKAAGNGSANIIKALVDAGANVNGQDNEGYSALHNAAYKGSVDSIKALLDAGANVNLKESQGAISLHIAAGKGDYNVVRLLLRREAKVNAQDDEGFSALHVAAYKGSADTIRVLLDADANVNLKGFQGSIPLHIAAGKGRYDAARLLLRRGADVNAQDNDGFSALHTAAEKGWGDIIKLLLDTGTNVNLKTNGGDTPLYVATINGNYNAAKLLLRRGADVNAQGDEGSSALYYAAQHGKADIIKVLLDACVNVNLKTQNGGSPLHIAALNGHYGVVGLLLRNGADLSPIAHYSDMKGTPEQVARKKGHHEIADLIKSFRVQPFGSRPPKIKTSISFVSRHDDITPFEMQR